MWRKMNVIYDAYSINAVYLWSFCYKQKHILEKKETKNSILISAHKLSPDLELKSKYKRILPY